MSTDVDTHDDLRMFIEGLAGDPYGADADLTAGDPDDTDPGVEARLAHRLKCRQGLGNAYNYDDSWFQPDSTCELWTKCAFYRGPSMLLRTGWRYKGSANPLGYTYNRWTWQSTEVTRAYVWWFAGVKTNGGYDPIGTWGGWASCS